MKTLRYFLLLSLIFMSWIPVARGQEVPHVLLLNSYHYGLDWTDDETAGVREELEKSGRTVELHVEYMDTKRIADETHFGNLRQLLEYKYRNTRFASILVTDNDAFNFIRKYRNIPIFAGVPVIFAGVNYFHQEALSGLSGFTGIAETFEGGKTVEGMLRLHPGTKRIVIVIDSTTTGEAIRKELEPMLVPFVGQVGFEFWDKLSLGELRTRLPTLDKASLVLLMPFARDSAGTFIRYEDIAAMVSRISPVPVYGTYDFYMGHGIVGGRLTNGVAQGRAAADILLRVLDGEDPNRIPVMTVAPSEYQFDSRQLHRYNIDASDLPSGSRILFQSWYEIYRTWIWVGGILLFTTLLFGGGWARAYFSKRQSDKALRISEEKLRTVLARSSSAIFTANIDGRFTFANRQAELLLGYSASEFLRMSIPDSLPAEELQRAMAAFQRNLADEHVFLETPLLCKDGRLIIVEISGVLLPDGDVLWELRDITERKQADAQIKRSLSLLQATLESTTDAILVVDLNNTWRLHNQQFLDLWNIPDEIIAANDDNTALAFVLNQLQDADGFLGKVRELYVTPEARSFDTIKFKDGRTIERFSIPQLLDGEVVGRVWSFRDITAREAMEQQVAQLAFYDSLTNLPNRRLLNDRLGLAVASSKRTGSYSALMFLDLDNFKPLNDLYGHVVGDALLIEVAHRLKSCVREIDTIARFGGDEFVVVLNLLDKNINESAAQARNVAEKIRISLAQPYHLTVKRTGQADTEIVHHCTTSIGVVMFINHEGSLDDILKWADSAMYQAKAAGRNSVCFYEANA